MLEIIGKDGMLQVCASQICASQICIDEIRASQICIDEIRSRLNLVAVYFHNDKLSHQTHRYPNCLTSVFTPLNIEQNV